MSNKSLQKKLVTPEGTIVYYMNGKMHNWDGPAFIPEGDESRAEYYIYGVKYGKEEWELSKRNWNGLPWYKNMGSVERF